MSPSDSEEEESLPQVRNPYKVLGLEKDATENQIKTAYRKLALKHHPDKVSADQKEEAHTQFQDIAFAYAVLSDPTRRKRYDSTGSTAESIIGDDDFNWSEFYRAQFEDAFSTEAIEKFWKKYKGSDEEKDDVLKAFVSCKGSMKKLYEEVMLSNPLEDEDRFRGYIDSAIEQGKVKAFKAYTNETSTQKAARMREYEEEAGAEAEEAMEHAKEIGVYDKLFGDKKAGKKSKKHGDDDALKALIQQRQQDRGSFFDQLEAKYAPKAKSKGSKKRVMDDEPSEEAFQAAASRLKKGGTSKKSKK